MYRSIILIKNNFSFSPSGSLLLKAGKNDINNDVIMKVTSGRNLLHYQLSGHFSQLTILDGLIFSIE